MIWSNKDVRLICLFSLPRDLPRDLSFTGGATYGLSDDEDSLFGANNKTKKTTTAKVNKPTNSAPSATTGQVKKGLTKTTTVVESDDESLDFESSTSATAATSKAATAAAPVSQDAKTLNKRRLMRVDDDEDE